MQHKKYNLFLNTEEMYKKHYIFVFVFKNILQSVETVAIKTTLKYFLIYAPSGSATRIKNTFRGINGAYIWLLIYARSPAETAKLFTIWRRRWGRIWILISFPENRVFSAFPRDVSFHIFEVFTSRKWRAPSFKLCIEIFTYFMFLIVLNL